MICQVCKNEVRDDAKFCVYCGSTMEGKAEEGKAAAQEAEQAAPMTSEAAKDEAAGTPVIPVVPITPSAPIPPSAPAGQPVNSQPQAPYGQAPAGQPMNGQPQAPYGQAPAGQPMNGQPQAPYGQAPYGQPQPQAPYGQPPEGQPQAPYGQPQPQAPYGQPQYQRQQFQPTTNYSSTYHQQGNPQGMPPYQMPVAAGEEPLRVSQYIGMMIVGALPLIGFIMLLVWAFGGSYNTNKRNYARAILLLSVILTVVSIAAIILLTLIGSSLITSINDYYNYM